MTIPNSVISIKNTAFGRCTSLTSITIPSSVTSIGASVFYDCTSLAFVLWDGNVPQELPQEVPLDNTDIFEGCSGLQKLVVCDSYADAYKSSFNSYSDKVEDLTTFKNNAIIEISAAQTAAQHELTEQDETLLRNYLSVIGSATLPSVAFTNKKCALGIINLRPTKNTFLDEIEWNVYVADEINGILTEEDKAAIEEYIIAINAATDEETLARAKQSALNVIHLREAKTNTMAELSALDAIYRGIDFNTYKDAVTNATSVDEVDSIKDAVMSIIENGKFATIGSIKYLLNNEAGEYRYNGSITFTDKDSYQSGNDFTVTGNWEYSRTFKATGVWQAWFVPFDVTVSKMNQAGMEVAKIAGVLMDGEVPYIAFAKMTDPSAIVKANTPYVVKTTVSSVNIKLTGPDICIRKSTNAELEAQRLIVQSSFDTFTFGGNYQQTNGYENEWYALNTSGIFQKMGEGVPLAPQRFWMTIDTRTDTPYFTEESGASAKAFIGMTVLGDEEPTGIESLTPSLSKGEGAIYNLNGIRVNNGYKGIVIKNGKKVLVK